MTKFQENKSKSISYKTRSSIQTHPTPHNIQYRMIHQWKKEGNWLQISLLARQTAVLEFIREWTLKLDKPTNFNSKD